MQLPECPCENSAVNIFPFALTLEKTHLSASEKFYRERGSRFLEILVIPLKGH